MRLLVLSRLRFLHSTRRLRAAAGRRGHTTTIADPLDLGLLVAAGEPRLFHGARPLGPVDVLVPRVGRQGTAHAVAAIRHLETMGVPTVNRAAAIERARDKLGSLQRLAREGVDVPRTALVRTPAALEAALERLGGPPVVLKLQQGSQGVGVILAESVKVAEAIPETEEEQKLYDSALRRRQLRLVLAGRMTPGEAHELRSIFDIKK